MIKLYNIHEEDHTSDKNNFYIGRGSILGNPFTYDGKRSSLAKLSFKTVEEAIAAYEIYFDEMYSFDADFKKEFDKIYNLYKRGEDVYLQCFCYPKPCHGQVIIDRLQKKLIKESLSKIKRAVN
ncbi:MAG: DUF4326 domain-containing protein [Bacilli bacterium]|nr:DUF4326 domain-containing protein [Bacilli bacterium]